MPTTLTSKGQVTIPKHVRDALGLLPGMPVEFLVHDGNAVLLRHASAVRGKRLAPKNRFEAARGKADVQWRTDDLMKLLRSDDD